MQKRIQYSVVYYVKYIVADIKQIKFREMTLSLPKLPLSGVTGHRRVSYNKPLGSKMSCEGTKLTQVNLNLAVETFPVKGDWF